MKKLRTKERKSAAELRGGGPVGERSVPEELEADEELETDTVVEARTTLLEAEEDVAVDVVSDSDFSTRDLTVLSARRLTRKETLKVGRVDDRASPSRRTCRRAKARSD